METKHLNYFKVENFKRFDSLEIKDIGQFNLIVGDNNVGKTTLLEALLFDEENFDRFQYNFWHALIWRKIDLKNSNVNYLNYFLNEKSNSITFQFAYDEQLNELTVKHRLKSSLNEEELQKMSVEIMINANSSYLLEFNIKGVKVLKIMKWINELLTDKQFDSYLPFIVFGSMYENDLVDYFSNISIDTDKLKIFQNSFKSFIPYLISIELNTALIPQKTVIAIREKDKDLLPLAQYGDGAIKLFRYLLELEFCQNKRLMIDEIDTGIHYSRLKDFLKNVIETAKAKNVQIFATTHSKECMEYYTKALEELNMQDAGRIIRLADTKKGIKAFTMKFEEFDNALSVESEIR